MPRALLLLPLSLTLALIGGPGRVDAQDLIPRPDTDPSLVLDEARNLARAGRYEEALQRQIWFRDHALRKGVGMGGVRQSFALSDWLELGKKYPPAHQALVDRRDKDRAACLGEGGTSQDFSDVASINGYLDEDDGTIALFRQLDAEKPRLARASIHYAKTKLVEAGEYRLCAKYVPDPEWDFRAIRTGYEGIMKNKELVQRDPSIGRAMEKSFSNQTCELIEILVGAGRKPEAEAIRTRALDVRDDPQIREAIATAAARVAQRALPASSPEPPRQKP